MKWNNKFSYPKSSRSFENGLRKYLFGDEKLPSVTLLFYKQLNQRKIKHL